MRFSFYNVLCSQGWFSNILFHANILVFIDIQFLVPFNITEESTTTKRASTAAVTETEKSSTSESGDYKYYFNISLTVVTLIVGGWFIRGSQNFTWNRICFEKG